MSFKPYRPWEDYEPREYYPIEQTQPKVNAAYQASGLTDGVIVPVLKSVFIGFTSGVLGGLLTLAFDWQVNGWLVFGIVWFAVMPFSFLHYSSRGQWLIERISGADLNGDGYIGQPMQPMLPAPNPVRVEVVQDQGRVVDYLDLPEKVSHEQFAIFSRAVLGGRDLAEGVWGGPGGLWSMPTYRKLRDLLVSRGLMRWNNETEHARGISLTPAGRAVLRKFADTPTLEDK